MTAGTGRPPDHDADLLRIAVAKALLDRDVAKELALETRAQTPGTLDAILVERGLLAKHSIVMLRKELLRNDGRTIGGFRLLDRLGKGGMGTVWRAHQLSMDREVALKLLDPALANDRHFCERFLREATAMGAIAHPHVISCHDAGQDGRHLFIALELMSGGDVAALLQTSGGKLSYRRALEIIRDAADGLEAIHQAGLIHRDLKPGNLFLTPEGRAKVADLGLARAEESPERMTVTGAVVGTPAYMSPEQASGAADLDIRTDIYALGATLFCLVTGQAPYQGQTPYAVVAQVLSDDFPDPRTLVPELPTALAELILICTARDRDARPTTPIELANRCRHLLTDAKSLHHVKAPVDPTAETIATPITMAPARRRAWLFLAAASLILGLSAWYTWRESPTQTLPGWTILTGSWSHTAEGHLHGTGSGTIRSNDGFAADSSLRAAFVQAGPGSAAIVIPEWGVHYGYSADRRAFELTSNGPASILFSAPWPTSLNEPTDVRLNRRGPLVTVAINGRLSGLIDVTASLEKLPASLELSHAGDFTMTLPTTWTSDAVAVDADALLAQRLAAKNVSESWFQAAGAAHQRVITMHAALENNLNFKLTPGQSISVEPYPLDTWTCARAAPGNPLARHCTADGFTDGVGEALDPRFPAGCLLIKIGDALFQAGRITAAHGGSVKLLINDATPADAGGSIRIRIQGPE